VSPGPARGRRNTYIADGLCEVHSGVSSILYLSAGSNHHSELGHPIPHT
jgi:hypothetical protein